jgi:hypothetical protein
MTSWHNDKSTLWQVDIITSRHYDKSPLWQVNIMTSWHNDKSILWQVNIMTSQHYDKSTLLQVDIMTSQYYDKSTLWQVDIITSRHYDGQHYDKSTLWRSTCRESACCKSTSKHINLYNCKFYAKRVWTKWSEKFFFWILRSFLLFYTRAHNKAEKILTQWARTRVTRWVFEKIHPKYRPTSFCQNWYIALTVEKVVLELKLILIKEIYKLAKIRQIWSPWHGRGVHTLSCLLSKQSVKR